MRIFVLLAVALAPNSALIATDNLDESQAIREIERLGAKVTRDDMLPGRPVTQVRFSFGSDFLDQDVPLLKPFTKLTTLDLSNTKICGTRFRGAGLKELRDLKSLKTIHLNDTTITNAGLKELKDLKNLTTVGLWRTKTTVDGVKNLQRSLSTAEIHR